ncbi:MAG: hypothetical protein SCALA702_37780 [Melioribacteraceae bacterium]|nr:MAG: hypothetical protein SCALA702_37780 [Melioribacteraceae bacterium]
MIMVAVLIVAGVLFVFFTNNGLLDFFSLKGEVKELRSEIEAAKERLDDLKKEIDSLRTNKKKIEEIAREEYLMRSKNEEAFRVEEK